MNGAFSTGVLCITVDLNVDATAQLHAVRIHYSYTSHQITHNSSKTERNFRIGEKLLLYLHTIFCIVVPLAFCEVIP